MYDKTLTVEKLQRIEQALLYVLDHTADIKTPHDFALTQTGMYILDSVSIKLMAVGEELHKINKKTNGELLANYPQIEWQKIIAFRNFIAHAYFEIDARHVFNAVNNNVKPLLQTIQEIIDDLCMAKQK